MDYSKKSSILFKFKDGVAKFVNAANGDTASNKDALEKLAGEYSMRIIETDTHDEDRVGFKGSAPQSLSFM